MSDIRNLVVILGDQLNRDASVWQGFDPAQDSAFMCEATEEATHVWCSQQRLVVFLSAMRHFAQALAEAGVPLIYTQGAATLSQGLAAVLAEHQVQRVVLTEPGEHRVRQTLMSAAAAAGVPLALHEDRHFLCSSAEFQAREPASPLPAGHFQTL